MAGPDPAIKRLREMELDTLSGEITRRILGATKAGLRSGLGPAIKRLSPKVIAMANSEETEHVYQTNPVHRNGTSGKSQWQIDVVAEEACFSAAIANKWGTDQKYWGLHLSEQEVEYVGVDRDHATKVFVAEFVGKSQPAVWHGYPVNHRTCRLTVDVLRAWLDKQVLSPAKIAKITARKPCSL